MSDQKYAVIGGQYNYYTYGIEKTLQAAKVLASKNNEYWDNWECWRTPSLYRMEHVKKTADGYVPKFGAEPEYEKLNGKWVKMW